MKLSPHAARIVYPWPVRELGNTCRHGETNSRPAGRTDRGEKDNSSTIGSREWYSEFSITRRSRVKLDRAVVVFGGFGDLVCRQNGLSDSCRFQGEDRSGLSSSDSGSWCFRTVGMICCFSRTSPHLLCGSTRLSSGLIFREKQASTSPPESSTGQRIPQPVEPE